MISENILVQRVWTEDELLEAGFRYFERKKRVVLARELPSEDAPLKIKYKHDTLIATAGYMICFAADWRKKKSLYNYDHWPVAPDHFADLYVDWNDPWRPKRGQKHLITLGCKPYCNIVGVWAKRLANPQWIQGVEHDQPFQVPAGAWLLVAAKGSAMGAPYWSSDQGFRNNFIME